MSYDESNLNRINAVKQIGKGLRNDSEVEVVGGMANAFVYIGDMLSAINKSLEKRNEIEAMEEIV